MLGSFLDLVQQRLVWAIPIAMLLGIGVGATGSASVLEGTILPLTFLMVYPMMINLPLPVLVTGRGWRLQGITQLINFGVVPFLALGIGRLFLPHQPLVLLGLLLAALLPTSGMTISWTGFARGNLGAAVRMTVIGLILGSLATPLYAKALMGAVVEIPMGAIFRQILGIVFLPMLLGQVTRWVLIAWAGNETYQRVLKPRFPAFSTLGVLGIVFVAMALKAPAILARPQMLLSFLLPLLLLYGINFGISTLIGRWLFPRGDAIALVYGTVMRNLSIALAIAMTAFGKQGSEIALIITMAYIIQVQAAAWYVRLTDRLFGPAPEVPTGSA